MRNYFKWGFFKAFGIIALAAIIIFAGCKNGTGGDDDPSGDDPPSGLPAISGTVSISGMALVGEILTADINALAGTGAASYKWQQGIGGGTFTDIVGGTAGTYTVTVANLDKQIQVEVRRASHTGSKTSAPTDVVTLPLLLKNITEVEAAIDASLQGSTASDPIPLTLAFDMGNMTSSDSNWQKLLDVLETEDKFVELDLSACTINGGTAFAPYKDSATGEDKVVSLVLPDAAQTITEGGAYPTYTFGRFTALTTVSGAGITAVSNNAFNNCDALTSVNFPVAVTIGTSAFENCSALTSIPSTSFPAVETIGMNAFASCPLTSVNFPAAKTIDTFAFASTSLTSIPSTSFPAVTSIGMQTFYGCDALTSVNLPVVISIGSMAFGYCPVLTSVSVPVAETIGYMAFAECPALTSVSVPAAKTIGGYAFKNCRALASVSLPAVETISAWAFVSCAASVSIFTITIKASCTYNDSDGLKWGSGPAFKTVYDSGSVSGSAKAGGTYTYTKPDGPWTYTP